MTDLRKELARAYRRAGFKKTGFTDEEVSAYVDCRPPSDRDFFFADALLPIIERRIAAARKEERERCAKVVEREILAALLPGDGALQAETHRKQIAAAIRALGDE